MIILDGKELRKKKLEELKERIKTVDKQLGLAVVQVGADEAKRKISFRTRLLFYS